MSHFVLSTGNEMGGALWRHSDHQIHMLKNECSMCEVIPRLNDLRCGYVCLHTHTLIQRENGCSNGEGSAPEASMTCSGCHDAIWA